MPDEMLAYGREAAARGLSVIIAGAGGSAHLPGMLASVTPLPVIGVPVALKYLDGMDSLLSIVQMPAGVPVATVAVGNARNAGLLAVRILAATDADLQQRMLDFQGRAPRHRPGQGQGRAGRCGPPARLLAAARVSSRSKSASPLVDDAIGRVLLGVAACRVAESPSQVGVRDQPTQLGDEPVLPPVRHQQAVVLVADDLPRPTGAVVGNRREPAAHRLDQNHRKAFRQRGHREDGPGPQGAWQGPGQ
jgi:5-(carboxyamino)imidazole ribonucleotide mutase